ncbi:hypothetical protein [Tabrizicola flagellatus]|uniref:hypothetical protein n=1 Tax=Tabrizicola flagellatus TaxID=2593021 RepID=UPI0011F1C649|nr:hypothetical protein [Tabrizicola flagellatus]
MLNIVIVVLVYECVTALLFILCWRVVRGVDTRLPIAQAGPVGGDPVSVQNRTVAEWRNAPQLPWQILAIILGCLVLGAVALGASGLLGKLRPALLQADTVALNLEVDPILLRLVLPVGHFLILGFLFFRMRRSVLFPTVLVHLFLIIFCLLVTLLDPSRIETVPLTLVPIFATNFVLLILTHCLLTLLFCRSAAELAAAVALSAIAGAILAVGTTVISLASTLLAGPLFFFQLYLVSAFGIFGLYFCGASMVLTLWIRDERGATPIPRG